MDFLPGLVAPRVGSLTELGKQFRVFFCFSAFCFFLHNYSVVLLSRDVVTSCVCVVKTSVLTSVLVRILSIVYHANISQSSRINHLLVAKAFYFIFWLSA